LCFQALQFIVRRRCFSWVTAAFEVAQARVACHCVQVANESPGPDVAFMLPGDEEHFLEHIGRSRVADFADDGEVLSLGCA
jgi:hypothetical protein